MATSAESGGICLVSSAAECCAHATGHRQPQAAVAAIIQLRHTAAASRWRHVSKSGLQRLCCQGCHNSDSQQISMQFAQLIQGCATCIVMQPSRLKMRVILQSYLGCIVRDQQGVNRCCTWNRVGVAAPTRVVSRLIWSALYVPRRWACLLLELKAQQQAVYAVV